MVAREVDAAAAQPLEVRREADARTGATLWQFQAGAGVNAPPSSYSVNRKQYIVVAAGGNTQLDYKRGNAIIAFTLD